MHVCNITINLVVFMQKLYLFIRWIIYIYLWISIMNIYNFILKIIEDGWWEWIEDFCSSERRFNLDYLVGISFLSNRIYWWIYTVWHYLCFGLFTTFSSWQWKKRQEMMAKSWKNINHKMSRDKLKLPFRQFYIIVIDLLL